MLFAAALLQNIWSLDKELHKIPSPLPDHTDSLKLLLYYFHYPKSIREHMIHQLCLYTYCKFLTSKESFFDQCRNTCQNKTTINKLIKMRNLVEFITCIVRKLSKFEPR